MSKLTKTKVKRILAYLGIGSPANKLIYDANEIKPASKPINKPSYWWAYKVRLGEKILDNQFNSEREARRFVYQQGLEDNSMGIPVVFRKKQAKT